MDEEDFFPITQEQFTRIQTDRLAGISRYENERPMQRQEIPNLKMIFYVGGDNQTVYHRGYIDVYDVWEADNNLYLRHRVHDSTD
jgi:hypothetical protein